MPIEVMRVRDIYAEQTTQTIKALVVGPPGAGKTRSASTWPNVLYADIEGRLLSVRDRDVRRARIGSVQDMEELKAMLDQPPEVRAKLLGGPVDTLVVDTVDELARLIIKERLKAEKLDAMRVQDWGFLADTLRNVLRAYRNLADLNVVFNCHLKSTEDQETGRVEKKPDIQGAVGHEIAGYVDEAFRLVANSMVDPKTGERVIKRYLQTFPDSQHDWIKDHSGTLPMEFEINFNDDYQRMAKYIFGGPVAAPRAALTITTSAEEERRSIEASPTPDLQDEVLNVVPPTRKKAAKKASPKRPVETAPVEEAPLPVPPVIEEEPTPPPEPVPENETESSVSEAAPQPDADLCADCGNPVDNPDVAEVSEIRYGVRLCRSDFAARRTRK